MGEPAAHPVPPLTSEIADSRLLDSREVAQLLAIGRTKTFQLMASGQLPTVHIGRCVRVSIASLRQWIEAQTSPTTDHSSARTDQVLPR